MSGWFGHQLYLRLKTPPHVHSWEVVYFDAPHGKVIRRGTCPTELATELFGNWDDIKKRTTSLNHPETAIHSYFEEDESAKSTRIYGRRCRGCNEVTNCDAVTAQEFKREAGDHSLALAELRDALSIPDGSLFSYSTVPVEESIGQKT